MPVIRTSSGKTAFNVLRNRHVLTTGIICIGYISPVDLGPKRGQPGINCNKSELWFFL